MASRGGTALTPSAASSDRAMVSHVLNHGREQEQVAVDSHAKALAAQASGRFDREVVPVTLAGGRVVSADEGPREGTTLERLAGLKPAFKEEGSVTAGTSSQVCCGGGRSKRDTLHFACTHIVTHDGF